MLGRLAVPAIALYEAQGIDPEKRYFPRILTVCPSDPTSAPLGIHTLRFALMKHRQYHVQFIPMLILTNDAVFCDENALNISHFSKDSNNPVTCTISWQLNSFTVLGYLDRPPPLERN